MPLKEYDPIIYTDSSGADHVGYYLCVDKSAIGNCLIVLDEYTTGVFTYDIERLTSYVGRFEFKSSVPIRMVFWAVSRNVRLLTLRSGLSRGMAANGIMKILEQNPGWTGLSNNIDLPMKGENNGKSSGES